MLRKLFYADIANRLNALTDTKAANELLTTLPVVDLDTWATQYHPDLIREAELNSGTNHHTTRRDIAARMTTRTLRMRLR